MTILTQLPDPGNPTPTPVGNRAHSASQEAVLARRIEAGVLAQAVLAGRVVPSLRPPDAALHALVSDGAEAREELVTANRGLIWLVVNPAADRTGLDRDELYQEGCVGMLEAVERFDPSRGCFATFALVRIRLRVGEAAVTRLGSLGLPVKRARAWWQVQSAAAALEASGRRPRVDDIARASGRDADQVRALLRWRAARPLSLEDHEHPAPSASTPDGAVEGLLVCLDDSERDVIVHRFGLGAVVPSNYAEVARTLGISESSVRRRERSALERLRRAV